MSERFNWFEAHAREKLGMPPEWQMSFWSTHGDVSDDASVEVGGAVYGLVTRGPRKGRPNWEKFEPGTKKTVWLHKHERVAFKQAWVERTGKCPSCYGTGQEWRGWNHLTGSKYETCTECRGSGKPRVLA